MTTSSDSKCQSHPARTCNAMNALLLSLYLFFVNYPITLLPTESGLRGFLMWGDPKTVDDDMSANWRNSTSGDWGWEVLGMKPKWPLPLLA